MAIIHYVLKWHNYLLRRRFCIQIDHKILKYLLEQQISTMNQQKWLVKLMGYDYEIKYRLGWDNIAADALSRLHGELSAITYSHPTWLEAISLEAHNDPTLSAMRDALKNGTICTKGYEEKEGHLWYKGCLVLSPHSLHKEAVVHEFHYIPIGGTF